jgi:hypothetical protein
MRAPITGNAQLCKMRYMIQQASATKHVLDKGASNMVAVCGELDELPPKNLLEERQQTRKGQIPATKVTVATTAMFFGLQVNLLQCNRKKHGAHHDHHRFGESTVTVHPCILPYGKYYIGINEPSFRKSP